MKKQSILIVEDETVIALSIQSVLLKQGYSVAGICNTGEEAVTKALTTNPNLVLMDIHLKGKMDGIEAASAILAEIDVPIVYLTAYTDDETLERAKRTGPYGYIPKPFQEIELKTSIEVSLFKHRMERQVRESEARFRSLFENSPDAIFIVDMGGNLLDINPAGIALLGQSKEKLMAGLPAALFGSASDPATFMDTLMESRQLKDVEVKLSKPDGSTLYLLETVSLLADKSGRTTGMQGILHDVTEKKGREEELRLLQTAIDHSAEAVVITNLEGNIVYTNPAFASITGFARDEILGQNPRILKSGKQDTSFYEQLWKAITDGESWSGEIINRRKDGSLYHQRCTISPVKDEKGSISHFVGISMDITIQKKMEEQLTHTSKMEALSRLAGGIAHDFNNLLVVINGNAELLLFESLDPSLQEKVKQILLAGHSATHLVNKVLTFSRRQTMEPEVVSINEVFSEFHKLLKRVIGENISMKLDLSPDTGLIWIDPVQLEQAIMNLILNAKDAMPSGGVLTLTASNRILDEAFTRLHPGSSPGKWVEVGIVDTGTGIEPDHLNHIFEPFFTFGEKKETPGLGLAIVYGIVKQNQGFIIVSSEVGEGTTFSLFFPVYKRKGEEEGLLPGVEARRYSGKTALIVEDNEQTRLVLAMILISLGFKVLSAATGEEALEMARTFQDSIDLLFSDVVLTGIPGTETADKILALKPEIKVILYSGYPQDEIKRRGIETKNHPFVKKPISTSIIRKKLSEISLD